jgi:hypothetical protein
MRLYERRYSILEKKLARELRILESKHRFLEEIIGGQLVVFRRPDAEVEKDLIERGYPKFVNTGVNLLDEDPDAAGDFSYLINMPIRQFTGEKLSNLANQCESKRSELATHRSKTPSLLWSEDLDQFEDTYTKWMQQMEISVASETSASSSSGAPKKRVVRKTTTAKNQ